LTFCCEAYRIRDRNIQYETQPGVAIAQLLINHGSNPNGIDNDATPILEAIRHDFYDLIDLLLDNGAIIKPETSAIIAANTVEMLVYLVEKGIVKNFNAILSEDKIPILHHTIQSNNDLVKYLIEQGADLYAKDKGNKTAFHHALFSDDLEFIDYLLNYYDVKKCHEMSSVFEAVDNKKTIKKLKEILEKTV
jgi:ankyrin repeat protein